MTDPNPIPQASSLETIINSIRYDPHVYRWFSLLIDQPRVKERLVADDAAASRQYRLRKGIAFLLALVYALSGILLFLVLKTRNYPLVFFLPVLAYFLIRLSLRKKEMTAHLSRRLLSLDYPGDSLSSKTLYQIAEIYSRANAIPSLVDTIYHWDRILRWMIAALTLVLFSEIYNLGIRKVVLAAVLTWILTNAIIRWDAVYKRLK